MKKFLSNNQFTFVAYSFGALIALEVVRILESLDYDGTIIIIDSSPQLMAQMLLNLEVESDGVFQIVLFCHLLSFYVPFEEIEKHKVIIYLSW